MGIRSWVWFSLIFYLILCPISAGRSHSSLFQPGPGLGFHGQLPLLPQVEYMLVLLVQLDPVRVVLVQTNYFPCPAKLTFSMLNTLHYTIAHPLPTPLVYFGTVRIYTGAHEI